MLTLGIETSCDDTSLALVEDERLLHHVSASQEALHALFGGVVPELASREHHRTLGLLFDQLMHATGKNSSDLDLISVARGPGLLGSLLVGVNFAKALAFMSGRPLIGVHHLHAHLLAYGLESPLIYPSLGLLVSGGHTHLYQINSSKEFILLGKSLDDAAGEAFDKAGKMLGLPYPAGRCINQLALGVEPDAQLFPRPLTKNNSVDFSFSGLKTAMAVYLKKIQLPPLGWDLETGELQTASYPRLEELKKVCASYTLAVIETLAIKTEKALLAQGKDIKALVLAGGVASNTFLRETMAALADRHGVQFKAPSAFLCTDNGAMIAFLGCLLAKDGFYHKFTFDAVARGKRIPNDMQNFLY